MARSFHVQKRHPAPSTISDPIHTKKHTKSTCVINVLFTFSHFLSAATIFNRHALNQIFNNALLLSSDILDMALVWIRLLLGTKIILLLIFTFEQFQTFKNPRTDFGLIVYVTMVTLMNLYIYCYFGEYTSSSFAKYTKYFYESNWTNLPIKYQKYLIPLIGNSQRPMLYDGFQLAPLNLSTFLKVFRF